MLVSSSFARQPLLAVVLVFGFWSAFGALILRLQQVLFGEPSGPAGEVKAILCAAVSSSRARADGRALAAGAGGALVPRRRRAVGMTRMSERLAALIAERTPVAGHRPWPRYRDRRRGVGHDRAGARRRAAAICSACGATRTRSISRCASPAQPQPCVVSLRMTTSDFPSVGRFTRRRSGSSARCAIFMASRRSARRTAVRGSITAPGACARRSARGRRRCGAIRPMYDFLPAKGEGLHQIPVGPVHAGIIEPGHFRFSVNGETWRGWRSGSATSTKASTGSSPTPISTRAAKRRRAHLRRFAPWPTVLPLLARSRRRCGSIRRRARKILRGVMAELERIANHLGDIGAICNDASFSLIHAHCGIFRERVLAAADRAFGHRLMMDRVVPGGVRGSRHRAPRAACRSCSTRSRSRSPRSCGSMTTRRPCRIAPARPASSARTWSTQWAAGGHVGRASGRNFDSRRDLPYAPYNDAPFEVPVFTAGDVDARVWVRIREVEQSIALLRHWLGNLPSGPARVELRDGSGEGIAMTEAFRGDVLVCVRIEATAASRGPCARRVMVPVAAVGGRDRGQHRRRLPALQQIVQLLVFGARPLMRTLLLRSLFLRPVTVAGAAARCGCAAERGCDPRRAWPRAGGEGTALFGALDHHPRGRCRLLQRLRAGNPCAQQCGL